jgi:hypothetical protein
MPLLPLAAVPDVNDSCPDTPLVPASADRTLNTPLDVALPYPVSRDTAPPVLVVLSPAAATTRPPAADTPEPTTTLTDPPAPEVADPVRTVTMPELPTDVVPVTNCSAPLTPLAPASAVRTLNTPLDVARP